MSFNPQAPAAPASAPPSENNKPQDKAYLVCHGALCNCDKGSVPTAPLQVLSHTKYFINDRNGGSKRIGTTKEIDIKALNFGLCTSMRKACQPQLKWTKFYDYIDLGNGSNPLLDVSEAICSAGGGKVVIKQHGQTITASSMTLDNAATATHGQVNFLAPAPGAVRKKEELPGIKHIQLLGKSVTAVSSQKKIVSIRPGEEVLFSVADFSAKTTEASKPNTSWVVCEGHGFKKIMLRYKKQGPLLRIKFDHPGKYRVTGYGKEATWKDPNASIDISVEYLKPEKIEGPDKSRPNETQQYTVTFNIQPTPEELKQLSWVLRDSQGNVLYSSGSSNPLTDYLLPSASATGPTHGFKFFNPGDYTIQVTYAAGFPFIILDKKVNCTHNGVLQVSGAPAQKVRPGTAVTAKVARSVFNPTEAEKKGVNWIYFFNGQRRPFYGGAMVKTGEVLRETLQEPGQHTFEAYGLHMPVPGNKTGFDRNENTRDQYTFLVAHNEVHQVNLRLPSAFAAPAEQVGASPEFDMSPATETEKAGVKWNVYDDGFGQLVNGALASWQSTGDTLSITFNKEGTYYVEGWLRASTGLESRKESLRVRKIVVKSPLITKAFWAYSTGRKMQDAGYNQKVYAYMETEGMTSRKIVLEIWRHNKNTNGFEAVPADLIETREATVDAKGLVFEEFTLKEDPYKTKLRELLPPDSTAKSEGQLYFTVRPATDYQIEKTPATLVNGKKYYQPLNAPDYLQVVNTVGIYDIAFMREDGKGKQCSYTAYGKQHAIHLYTTNMIGKTVHVQVFRKALPPAPNSSQPQAPDEEMAVFKDKKIGDDGILELDFSTKEDWKAQHQLPDLQPREFYVKVFEGDKFLQEQTAAGEWLRVIKELPKDKMADSEGCVMVEYGKTNKKERTNCYCDRDFTLAEFTALVTGLRQSEAVVFKKDGLTLFNADNCNIPAADKTMERLLEELNNTMRVYNINTCIRKIHFLAQAYWESDRFRTGLEYASGNGYNPGKHDEAIKNGNTLDGDGPRYKGRGLMQLTWRNTYLDYYAFMTGNSPLYQPHFPEQLTTEYMNKRENNAHEKVSDNLFLACDSAGWFFSNYKKIAYGKKENQEKYKDIIGKSLTEVADHVDKYQSIISIFVNGGGNGKAEREIYYKKLKQLFRYNTICKNNKNIRTHTGKAPWIPFALAESGTTAEDPGHNPRISEYFDASTNGKGLNDDTNWCGAFVSWCVVQAGYEPPPLSARAAMWQFYKQLEKEKPIYGAIAVIDWGDNGEILPAGKDNKIGGDGHVTMVVGKSGDGNYYYCIGGNQGGERKKRKVQVSRYSKDDIDWFVVPDDYEPTADEYEIPVMTDESDIDNSDSTRN